MSGCTMVHAAAKELVEEEGPRADNRTDIDFPLYAFFSSMARESSSLLLYDHLYLYAYIHFYLI